LKRACDPEILALLKPPEKMPPDAGRKLLHAAQSGNAKEAACLVDAGVFVDSGRRYYTVYTEAGAYTTHLPRGRGDQRTHLTAAIMAFLPPVPGP